MLQDIKQLKNRVSEVKTELDSINGKISFIKESIEKNNRSIEELNRFKLQYTKAIELLTKIQEITRDKVKTEFESLVGYALRYVFDQPYDAKLEFDRRGNLPTLDFKVKPWNSDDYVDPMNCNGGGIVNIYCFALRIVLLSLLKNEGAIVMDESMANVSSEYQDRAYHLINEISKKLNKQVIWVSHNPNFIDASEYKIQIGK